MAELVLDRPVVDAEGRAEVLEQAGGLPIELHGHAAGVVIESVEGDHASMVDLAAA